MTMKTVIVTIGGTLTPGDLLMLSYRHQSRGGNSTLKYRVRAAADEIVTDARGAKSVKSTPDTIGGVVRGLLEELARGQAWPAAEFAGAARPDGVSLAIKCSGDQQFADVEFAVEVEGAQTETMTLEVI